jgi:NTP pyrophosphatase (non-canonical NTP hydrolase)
MTKYERKQFLLLFGKIQKDIYQNKVNKKFNISDIPLEFCLVNGELAEAFESWLKKKESLGEELADVMIYLMGLAEILKIDLSEEILQKVTKNKKRIYITKNGVRQKKRPD